MKFQQSASNRVRTAVSVYRREFVSVGPGITGTAASWTSTSVPPACTLANTAPCVSTCPVGIIVHADLVTEAILL